MGPADSGVVHTARPAMEDSAEFDSVYIRSDLRSDRAVESWSTCTRGVPAAFECQPDALRGCICCDVRDSVGGGGPAAAQAAGVPQVDFAGWIGRDSVQFADLGISVCYGGEPAFVRSKDHRDA